MSAPTSDPSTRSPRPAWNRAALLVPLLVVLGIAGVVAYMQADDVHTKAQRTACGDLPPVDWQMYATAFGALACSVLAAAILFWLLRRARGGGRPVSAAWQGQLAIATAVLGLLPFLFQCFVVWGLYQPNPGGIISCAG